MASDWDDIDWHALDRMRSGFLEGSAGSQDYWESERDLRSYDLTFAQRIGWKWDHVLGELRQLGWQPPAGEILDWGCGSGIAHRAFLDGYPAAQEFELSLWDRSALAMDYAERAACSRFPGLSVRRGVAGPAGTVLVSHVMTELSGGALEPLVRLIRQSTCLVWVEAGTHEVSRGLGLIREELRAEFNVVAPCVHQGPCGVLVAGMEHHWCHHFASPPAGVFTDPNWARFAHITGIDLRSLPVSYLVMDRRPVPSTGPGATRILGRPRVYKAHALALGCDASGVLDRRITKRRLPDLFREARKDRLDSLQHWQLEDDEVIAAS
jgi:hypothetical protein